MTHLAKEFVLSDVALHKICKKHDIPKPPVGWWAKKAAGQKVTQTPLPKAKAGASAKITIAAGVIQPESDLITTARENARILASSIPADSDLVASPIVERSMAKVRRAKANEITGLASSSGEGLIQVEVAPASIDRLELALNRIVAAANAIGIKLVRGEKGAAFECEGEAIGFSITESTKREKHVLTEKELAEREAWNRKNARRWNGDIEPLFGWPRFPEWDYHSTGLLSFEFDNRYLWGEAPRRSFRDAKIQRLENMAGDIAVGIAVYAAAIKADRARREERARKEAEARHQRELALRAKHIEERRSAELEATLEAIASLDRLRRLVAAMRKEHGSGSDGRVATFLDYAETKLSAREAALSTEGLADHFERRRVFGTDDDHDFFPPRYF